MDLCRKNASEGLRIEIMESAIGGSSDKTVKLDPKLATVDRVLHQISRAFAGHASLELIHTDSVTDTSLFEPALKFYRDTFREVANTVYPLGHYAKATLWFSASRHVYAAHSDLADGFLFQFAGTKHVKVWPLPQDSQNLAIYNHSDLTHRQSLPYDDFKLEAGDVLFIPAGAVHEVTVEVGYISLAMSFHLGCPYALQSLWNDLRKAHENHSFSLPEKYAQTFKTDITFFNPAFDLADTESDRREISPALCAQLCKVIKSNCSDDELADYISEWWQSKLNQPNYKGPYLW
jgi:ribosomal protein L16 Arg81 hydroxylase